MEPDLHRLDIHDALTLSTMLSMAMDLVEGVVGLGGAFDSGFGSAGCGC